jgi:hypothetical protein
MSDAKVRSRHTKPISFNLPPEIVNQLRLWAAPVGGRTGYIIQRLVHQELARREERARLQAQVLSAFDVPVPVEEEREEHEELQA